MFVFRSIKLVNGGNIETRTIRRDLPWIENVTKLSIKES